MNLERVNVVVMAILAGGAILSSQTVQAYEAVQLAQAPPTANTVVQTQSAPVTAPSFLKQAGTKLLDSAQKKMLHNLNQTLQNQSASPATAPSTTTNQNQFPGFAGSPDGSTATMPGVAPSSRKQSAPCRSWSLPGEKPIACLLCVHGLGLQSKSYEFFGTEQSRRGIAVYALDVRGFGAWMKAQGKDKVNFDDCLEDIRQALESIRTANPGLPVYLLGESMGGAIALRAASMYPQLVDGLISSVPAGERFNQGKTSMKVFMNLIAGANIADVGKDIVNQATQNSKLKSQWQGDPLSRLNLSPQELIQFQDFMNNNHDAARKVASMPVLFVQGIGDQLVKPEGTWELFNSVASKDKSFFAVPGEHLIFEEADAQDPVKRDQNFRVISAWLSNKVGTRFPGMNRQVGWGNGTGLRDGFSAGPMGGPGVGQMGGPGVGQMGGPGMGQMSSGVDLSRQAQMIDNGQYTQAIAELEQMAAQQSPDASVFQLLGKAYYKSGQPERAAFAFRKAMRLSRGGGGFARTLNANLLDMSRSGQSMWVSSAAGLPAGIQSGGFQPGGGQPGGFQTGGGQPGGFQPGGGFRRRFGQMGGPMAGGFGTAGGGAAGMAGGRGKVYAFYSTWADQCNGMRDCLGRLSNQYGNAVDMQLVNIEDAASDPLVDQYNVGPIPTVVFVTPNGQVQSTIIGESTYNNYEQAFRAITRM
jgi:acylglycerol lipase